MGRVVGGESLRFYSSNSNDFFSHTKDKTSVIRIRQENNASFVIIIDIKAGRLLMKISIRSC